MVIASVPANRVENRGRDGPYFTLLDIYIRATQAHRVTDQLFVCLKEECQGRPLLKARLSHWIIDVIQQA